MGKMDHQRGQRLTLRCRSCKRPLGIFFVQKRITDTPKLQFLDGSVHKTSQGTLRIHARCKCGEKNVFESRSSLPTKQGWRRIT
jgi:hypothetical protein